MEVILSFYNFLDKDGLSIQNWMSKGSPRYPWICMLKRAEVQDEILPNEITGVSSKGKRKFNTIAKDEVKQKNISETFKNEKEDLQFVGGLYMILRVKVINNVWID